MKKICVLIAAYRDPELLDTIKSCLEQAEHSDRISFSICWQGAAEVEWQVGELSAIPNCRVSYYDHSQCQGVGWARLITQTMVGDEDYVLQIDSHSRLAKDWDSKLIEMVEELPEKSLLTAYPASYDPATGEVQPDAQPYSIGANFFNDYGVLVLQACTTVVDTPHQGYFLSAGFIFAPTAILGIPYDPGMIFNGEESSLAARYVTNGWNIYHPHEVFIYHNYGRPEAHRPFTDQNMVDRELASYGRYREIMGMDDTNWDYGVYGLGSVRSLEEYQQLCGVNFRERSIEERGRTGLFR
jgi:glycosyltransferase involved in cell wall biosynthesis